MLNLKEFVEEHYQWQDNIAKELHETENYDGRRAVRTLLDDLYEHYYEQELGNDPSWTKVDFNNLDSFPEDKQMVTYFFKIFGNAHKGWYDDGTFYSNSGFCDHHDVAYWKPREPILTTVISGFPGVGKTEYKNSQFDKGNMVLDSDSSYFSWFEDVDGNKERNPDFPNNYMRYIDHYIGTADVILVSSHQNVRDALVEKGIFFYLVYPEITNKDEYIQRYVDRGSDETFVNMLDQQWETFVNACETQVGCSRHELEPNEFLSDITPELIELHGLMHS
jgi:hypothetical protein